jgi:prepilin-type N-terminal cleavage/methylation domain-containing protein/prepilin-type processing-associated H-X9-DG protein
MNRGHAGGFSLIELLLVITIILIMFVMAYGPAQQSFQEKQLANCLKNLQLMNVAMKIYAADYHDSFPVVREAKTSEAPLSLLVPRCTTETAMFVCPGSRDRALPEAQPFANRKCSYAYYMGRTTRDGADAMLLSDEQINARPRHRGEPMFSADGKRPGNNHHKFGGNLLFADGHVEAFPPVAPRDLIYSNSVVLLNPKP